MEEEVQLGGEVAHTAAGPGGEYGLLLLRLLPFRILFELVESSPALPPPQVTSLQQKSKSGSLSDKDYFSGMKKILVPLQDIVEEPETQEAAMLFDDVKEEKEDKKVEKVEEVAAGGDGSSSSSSKMSSERKKNQPSIMEMFKKKPVAKKEKRKSSEDSATPDKRAKGEEEEGASLRERPKVIVEKEQKASIARCGTCRQLVDSEDTIRSISCSRLVMLIADFCFHSIQLLFSVPASPRSCRYEGHPDSAVEEFIGISDTKLSLFEDGGYDDAMPQYKLTSYTVCHCSSSYYYLCS